VLPGARIGRLLMIVVAIVVIVGLVLSTVAFPVAST
jgi:hypothetical protein